LENGLSRKQRIHSNFFDGRAQDVKPLTTYFFDGRAQDVEPLTTYFFDGRAQDVEPLPSKK